MEVGRSARINIDMEKKVAIAIAIVRGSDTIDTDRKMVYDTGIMTFPDNDAVTETSPIQSLKAARTPIQNT